LAPLPGRWSTGGIVAGPLAEIWGVRPWFVITGTAMSIIGITGLFIPQIKDFEKSNYLVDPQGKAVKVAIDTTI
jgi:hypothetical protein